MAGRRLSRRKNMIYNVTRKPKSDGNLINEFEG